MNKYYDYDEDVCSACSERKRAPNNGNIKKNEEKAEKIEL